MVDVSALILAGGKATRFGGIAKHALVVDGDTILARQTRVLTAHVREILVSSQHPIAGHETVTDAPSHVDAGPLAGIAAGLSAVRTAWMIVLAGDMPYITDELMEALLAAVPAGDGGDAVGVRVGGLPEPLVCVLHRRVLPVVERRIAARRFKASGLLTDEGLRVTWIDWADARALRNVNAPADLAAPTRE